MSFLEEFGIFLAEQQIAPAHGRKNEKVKAQASITKINVHASFDPQPISADSFLKRYVFTSDLWVRAQGKLRQLQNGECDSDGDLIFDDLTLSSQPCNKEHTEDHTCETCKLPHLSAEVYNILTAGKSKPDGPGQPGYFLYRGTLKLSLAKQWFVISTNVSGFADGTYFK